MIIGITGRSGSGKSTLAQHLRGLEYEVIDVDIIHKRIASEHENQINEIYKAFGYSKEVIEDKKAAIQLFFRNSSLRESINYILFPKVKEELEASKLTSERLLFIDAPLLKDMELDSLCDKIWFVSCNKKVNYKRLMNRNNINKLDAAYRYRAIDFSWVEGTEIDLNINLTKLVPKLLIEGKIKEYEKRNICGEL